MWNCLQQALLVKVEFIPGVFCEAFHFGIYLLTRLLHAYDQLVKLGETKLNKGILFHDVDGLLLEGQLIEGLVNKLVVGIQPDTLQVSHWHPLGDNLQLVLGVLDLILEILQCHFARCILEIGDVGCVGPGEQGIILVIGTGVIVKAVIVYV